jgi:hypothetical protein
MSQEEVKTRMQLARLNGSNGINSGRRGREEGEERSAGVKRFPMGGSA